MRVILVNPRMCSPRSRRLPLSLLALAAVLEDRHQYHLVDGNVDPDAAGTVRRLLQNDPNAAVGITVMPGPQIAPAIEVATAARTQAPHAPIIWGGYFPTLYAESAINAPYVDYVVRGQGEVTLLELLDQFEKGVPSSPAGHDVAAIDGLTWKRDGQTIHNPDRAFRAPDTFPMFPYHALGNATPYLRPSFMGRRTAVHQAAIGCRFRCAFCGVVSMFDGHTTLQGPERLDQSLSILRNDLGADAVQYYDHNFFDDEESSIPLLEVMTRHRLPWWCYARTDTLAGFSTRTWELIQQSGLKMTYVGAEAASDDVLRTMHKGSRVEYTLEVAERTKAYGVIPEFSFVLGGPDDPEGEIDHTFQFVKRVKQINPQAEIILYFYSPTPQRPPRFQTRGQEVVRPVLDTYGPGGPALPTTPEGWTDPTWVDYVCHRDAPWLTPALRQRVRDFADVLACRFPTVQDYHTPRWGKRLLRGLASWRYATGRYRLPWELKMARRLIPLREPARESI